MVFIMPLTGLCAYQMFLGNVAITIISLMLSLSLIICIYLLPKLYWDPLYILKARSWLGASVSYEISGANIIHTWNGARTEIPISGCTGIISPAKGLIICFGSHELVLHESLPQIDVSEFHNKMLACMHNSHTKNNSYNTK